MSIRDSVRSGGPLGDDGPAPAESLAPVEGLASPEALVRRSVRPESGAQVPEAAGSAAEQEGSAAPSVDVVWLESEVQRANRASGPERRQRADAINTAFVRIGQTVGSRGLADFLLRQLESGTLRGLVDSEGRTCRAVATEALLALGYPYALEISPEDLEHLREDASGRRRLTPWAVAGLGLVSLSGLYEGLGVLGQPDRALAVAQAVMGIAAAVAAALTKAKTAEQGLSLFALFLAGLLGVGLSFVLAPGEPALVGGLGALVAWVILLLRR